MRLSMTFYFLIFSPRAFGAVIHLHFQAGKTASAIRTFALQKNYTRNTNIDASNASIRRKTRESVATDSRNGAGAVSFGGS
jgi:hypothetical protein